jgi:hypothetical protein
MDPDPEGKLIADPPDPNSQEHLHLNSFKTKAFLKLNIFFRFNIFLIANNITDILTTILQTLLSIGTKEVRKS